MAASDNPHIIPGTFSPLSSLISQAMRQYGDFPVVDGETALMLMDFANTVLMDVRMHPYAADLATIPQYTHVSEVREVPDRIMKAGLLAYYAVQQGSQKAQMYLPLYQRTLNAELWFRLNGNTPISMRPVDASEDLSTVNGQPE